jgi:hypothetical protein
MALSVAAIRDSGSRARKTPAKKALPEGRSGLPPCRRPLEVRLPGRRWPRRHCVRSVERTGLTEYRAIEGNQGCQLLTRDLGDGRCEVVTLSCPLRSATGFPRIALNTRELARSDAFSDAAAQPVLVSRWSPGLDRPCRPAVIIGPTFRRHQFLLTTLCRGGSSIVLLRRQCQ